MILSRWAHSSAATPSFDVTDAQLKHKSPCNECKEAAFGRPASSFSGREHRLLFGDGGFVGDIYHMGNCPPSTDAVCSPHPTMYIYCRSMWQSMCLASQLVSSLSESTTTQSSRQEQGHRYTQVNSRSDSARV